MDFHEHRVLGRTGLSVSRIGLAGGYKVPTIAVERAFHEYGINYFYWVGRKPGMGEALKSFVKTRRDDIVIAVQSYDHTGLWLRGSAEKALKQLGIDQVDIFFLGWCNSMPGKRVMDVSQKLKEEGKIRFLGITGHNRSFHGECARRGDSPFDVHQFRYNAAHRGAEEDILKHLPENRPGLTTYTATDWGKLLKPKKMPDGERPLTASCCYRFALSHPDVDLCLAGPRNAKEMEEGLQALSDGPLSQEESMRIRKIGDYIYGR